jgi:hypothetical protein
MASPAPARGLRADRLAGPAHLAARHPRDLPPRGRPPRRAVALHQRGRPPLPGPAHRPARPRSGRLELRHRQRARVEDRIGAAKATGLGNLPLDLFRRNQVWLELVLAAQDLVCFTQALLLDGHAHPRRARRCAPGCCRWPPASPATPRRTPDRARPAISACPSHTPTQRTPLGSPRAARSTDPAAPNATMQPPSATMPAIQRANSPPDEKPRLEVLPSGP